MYMKTLIGRMAGSIVSMQKHVAEAAAANGTHEPATIEEIAAAGLMRSDDVDPFIPESFPDGINAVFTPDGFELVDADGRALEKSALYPNLVAARHAAWQLKEAAAETEIDREDNGAEGEDVSPDAPRRGRKPKMQTEA